MNKIKMTLMEKSNFLRAEMDLDRSIIDWNNVEIIDDKEYQEAKEQNQSKLELEKELSNLSVDKVSETYQRITTDMLYLYQNMEEMKDVKAIYRLFHYAEKLVEKAQKLDK